MASQRFSLDQIPDHRVLSTFLSWDLAAPFSDGVAMRIFKWFEQEKTKLKNVVKLQRVSVVAGIWTSKEKINYMSVTARWIDGSWTLQHKIIGFIPILDIRGETVARELINCFDDWEITQVHTITLDNALSNGTTIELLKEKLKEKGGTFVLDSSLLHMRCVGDIANSIAEDGFTELAPSVARIRNALTYVRSFAASLEMLQESKEGNRFDDMDVETKWTSNYTMLKAALSCRKGFDRLKDDVFYRSYFAVGKLDGPPVDSDWENVKSFVRYLGSLYTLVSHLSMNFYSTSNFSFLCICNVKNELLEDSQNANNLMRQMAVDMDGEFVKHWGDPEKINHVFFLAMVLDPRYKMFCLAECLEIMFKAEAAQKLLNGVKASLYKLFKEYNDDLHPPEHSTNEVDDYLSECREDMENEDFDILDWWSENEYRFSVLARIAKDLLAVSVSSIQSHSLFSASERLLNPYQSLVSPVTLEAVVCAKNWFNSDRREAGR